MTPSKYQEAIFQAVKSTNDNLIIRAVAGSGKTTTIVEALKLVPPSKKCLFLAFNKAIALSLSERVPPHVEAKTMHSLGWGVCSKNIGWFRSNGNKVRNIFYYKVNDMNRLTMSEKKLLYAQTNAICNLVSLMKANLVLTHEAFEDRWMEIAEKNDIKLPKDLKTFKFNLSRTYWLSMETLTVVDFDDMILFPTVKDSWEFPKKYDCIFIDEAQDLSPVQHLFLSKFLLPNGRIIAVGDPSQAIYGFSGASPYSMAELEKKYSMKSMPLSICYRCGSSIVEKAQRLVPEIESHPEASAGQIRSCDTYSMMLEATAGDMIICRNVSPILSLVPQFLMEHRAINFPYPDIVAELVNALEICRGVVGNTTGQGVHKFLLENSLATEHGDELAPILKTFAQLFPITPITEKHIVEFLGEKERSVFISSIHKAKGLEANRVYIYRPELMPAPNATQDWQLLQEKNLEYVAITRAKKELVYVSE